MLPWKLLKLKFYLSIKIFHQYIFHLPSFSLWAATFLLSWFGKWIHSQTAKHCVQPPYLINTGQSGRFRHIPIYSLCMQQSHTVPISCYFKWTESKHVCIINKWGWAEILLFTDNDLVFNITTGRNCTRIRQIVVAQIQRCNVTEAQLFVPAFGKFTQISIS